MSARKLQSDFSKLAHVIARSKGLAHTMHSGLVNAAKFCPHLLNTIYKGYAMSVRAWIFQIKKHQNWKLNISLRLRTNIVDLQKIRNFVMKWCTKNKVYKAKDTV